MDRGRRWIAAGDGTRPENDCGRRWITWEWSCPEMDRSRIWIAAGYGWMTGDGSRETDDNRSPSYMHILRLCEVLPSRDHDLDFILCNQAVTMERRYADIRCTGGMVPLSTIQSTIQWYRIMQLQARVPMRNMIPNKIPSHYYNADTAQAVQD